MIVAAIDWTMVLTSLIVGAPAIIAAVFTVRVHSQIRTPSGKSLGEVAEYTHDTSIANNMILSQGNGPTQAASRAAMSAEGKARPRMPETPPPAPQEG